MDNKISQVLIPEEKVFEVKGGKKKIKYKNFFPGYILVEAVLDKEVMYFLSRAPSVLKMVGDKNEAIALVITSYSIHYTKLYELLLTGTND